MIWSVITPRPIRTSLSILLISNLCPKVMATEKKGLFVFSSFGTLQLKSQFSGKSSGGASGGFIFVGILIGALLAGFGIIAWRKWNRRNGMSSFRHISYTVSRTSRFTEFYKLFCLGRYHGRRASPATWTKCGSRRQRTVYIKNLHKSSESILRFNFL